MPKIAIITPEYPPLPFPGGVAESVKRISNGLSKQGLSITVITLPNYYQNIQRPHLDITEKYNDGTVSVVKLNPAERTDRPSQSALYSSCFEWICDFIEHEKPDLLHGFYVSSTGFITGAAAKECGIPFICSVRGNDLHKSIFAPKDLSGIMWALQNANFVTFVSENLRSRAQRLFSLKGPSKVVWNSIDPDEFANHTHIPETLRDLQRPIICIAGSIRQKKGLEVLLDACSALGFALTLLIIGQIREEEQVYWQELVFPKVSHNVKIQVTGMLPHQDILDYYKLSDVMVISSTHDGCPNVMMEAFLAKVPVISTTRGAMKEIIERSKGGLLYSASNSTELAEKIRLILNDSALKEECIKNAFSFVTSELTPSTEIAQWVDIYNSVLDSSNLL